MSRLDELIAELCPNGVEQIALGDIIFETKERNKECRYDQVRSVTNDGILVPTSEYFDRQITSEDTSNYKVVLKCMFLYNPSRINIGSIAWSKENEPVIVSPMYIVFDIKREKVSQEYLIYYLRSGIGMHKINSKVEPGARFRLPIESLSKIKIPLPPLPVQREIIRILDKFTELTAELAAELTARKKQYEYYRDKLLTFEDNPEVKWMTLGEVCSMKAGKAISSNEISDIRNADFPYPCYGGNGLRGYVKTFNQTSDAPLIGRQGALCGNVCFATGEYYATEHAVVVAHGKYYNARFLYYLLTAMNLNQYKTAGAQPGLSVAKLEKIQVPVPPIEEQERIVAILDRFDALCNDLTSGLPAEIEARQKQYEYYRDKLLTFKEAIV
jgi:type I restriction enzyme S subunit